MSRDPLLPVRLVDGMWTTEGAGCAAVPTDDAPFTPLSSTRICDPYPPPFVGMVSIASSQAADATEPQPGIMAPMTWPTPAEPDLTIPWMPWNYDKTEPRQWAKPGAEGGTVEIGGQTFRAVMTWGEPDVKVRNMRCIPEPNLSEIVIPVTVDADEARKVAEYVLAHGQRTIFAAVAVDGSGVWAIGDSAEEARAGALDRRECLRDEANMLDLDFPDASTDTAWLDGFALVTLSGTTDSLRALIKSMETGDPVAPWCPADLWDSGEVKP